MVGGSHLACHPWCNRSLCLSQSTSEASAVGGDAGAAEEEEEGGESSVRLATPLEEPSKPPQNLEDIQEQVSET